MRKEPPNCKIELRGNAKRAANYWAPAFFNLSNPKLEHTTGGSGQGGARSGGGRGRAERRKTRRRLDGSPRKQLTLLSPRASKTIVLNDYLNARTNEILFVDSKTQTYHGQSEAGRRTAAGRAGQSGAGRTGSGHCGVGRRRVGATEGQPSILPPRHLRQAARMTPRGHEQTNSHANRLKYTASG